MKIKEYIIMGACAVFLLGVVGAVIFTKRKSGPETEVYYSYATMNAEELVKESAIIVQGKVLTKETQKVTQDGVTTVMLSYTLQPTELIKGTNQGNITIEQETGVGNLPDDAVALEKGKIYFLFLRQETSGNHGILGGPQGKYTLAGSEVLEQDRARMVFGISEKVDLQKIKDILKKYL